MLEPTWSLEMVPDRAGPGAEDREDAKERGDDERWPDSTNCSIIPSLGCLLVGPSNPAPHDQDVNNASQHGDPLLLHVGSMVNPFREVSRLLR